MNRYNYTLIIPHYNSPQLLERLLNSIPKRNDLQVVVVDDCSPKKSYEQIIDLTKNYANIELITTVSNGGGGLARNLGLEAAKGKYVFFADSDDFFLPTLDNLLSKYAESEDELIVFNAISLDDISLLPSNRTNRLYCFFKLNEKDQSKGTMAFKFLFGEPWCKLIKREMIEKNHIRFDVLPIHNDTTFSYLCGYYAKSLSITNIACYCVTDRQGSVSKLLNPDKQLTRIKVFAQKNQFLKSHSINIFDSFLLNPLKMYLKNRDIKSIRIYLRICRAYGITFRDLIKGYLFMKSNYGLS